MKTNMPKLRFPEFRKAPEWEEKRLEAFADLYKGKGISKADISPDGQIQCIRYGELYTSYGEIIETVLSATNLPASELFFSKRNDVILPSSGETKEDISTASCVMLDDIALGGDLNVIRCDQCGKFISYYLNGQKKKEIAKIAQGDTVVHLYVKQLKQLEIALPKPLEQQKIADCLSSLDELIFTESRKLDALASYKKGLMQQLFPAEGETVPKLRFPEFRNAPAWKEKKLAEISHSYQGYGFPEKYQGKKSGEYPFYKVSDISKAVINGSLSITEAANYISSEVLSILQAKLVPPNAVIFAKIGEGVRLNRRAITTCKCVIDNNTMGLKAISGKCDDYFLYCILSQIDLIEYAGGVVPSINKSTIENIAIFCPSISEQKKIANCLASLDELIAVQTEKLGGLKNFKKGMMQQLFPAVDEVSV